MATINSVIATINGQQYELKLNTSTGKYEATITAPTTTSYHQNSEHYFPVSITALDSAGNSTTIDTSHTTHGNALKLRVKETEKPIITFNSIGANAILTNNSPSIVFTVTDLGAGVDTSRVVLKVDNKAVTLPTPTQISNGYQYTYTASALSDGAHTITIDAYDFDDNAAVTVTRSFSIDTVPPTLNITAPVDGTATNVSSVKVVGTTNDATSSPVTVKISVNGTDVGTVTVGADGSFSKTVDLASGNNVITITATDGAGKITTVTRNVDYDTSAPVFKTVTVAPNPVNTGNTYTITVEFE